jgi:hypothetical protein
VEEEGAASDFVEDFGALAFEAGAFACGHDGDGEVGGGHGEYGLMGSLSHKKGELSDKLLRCPASPKSSFSSLYRIQMHASFDSGGRVAWRG